MNKKNTEIPVKDITLLFTGYVMKKYCMFFGGLNNSLNVILTEFESSYIGV